MGNVKGFIDYIVNTLAKLEPNNKTPGILRKKLESMSKADIHQLYEDLKAERKYLPFYIPNDVNHKIDIKRWIKLSKEIGAETFVELIQEDDVTGDVTQTEIKYWVAMFPGRRHLHYLDAKRSIAKDNKTRDTLTGQVTGDSKGSSFSKPQLMGLLSRGCTMNAMELMKYRGGDISGGRELNRQLTSNGGVSLKSLLQTKTTPTVTKTTASYLTAMHLSHNLDE
ncbi:hypothetical protein TSMG0067 [Halocynthia phage JM-2012]|uniref:RNA polymerase beta subunit n=1 Tax=Halocynthia phage JM-2012 TaxID=1173297 RepID=UPI00025C6917|nr:RNA polymerase beta subunit [Halocynthia phage JM-2012]AFI55350.1 hypothetical protein TSMG0067 [Halocynthia phage JM-2012]